MRKLIGRVLLGVLGCWSAVDQAKACTNEFSAVVGQVPITTSVFVPTVISSAATVSLVAPGSVHVSGFGIAAVPQAVVVPQATTVQSVFVPQVFQQQVVRQRVRTTIVPRLGVRSLICR